MYVYKVVKFREKITLLRTSLNTRYVPEGLKINRSTNHSYLFIIRQVNGSFAHLLLLTHLAYIKYACKQLDNKQQLLIKRIFSCCYCCCFKYKYEARQQVFVALVTVQVQSEMILCCIRARSLSGSRELWIQS